MTPQQASHVNHHQELIELAQQALAAHDHERAANLVTQVLHADPANLPSALLLARICLARGREDAAAVALAPLDRFALQERVGAWVREPELQPELAELGAFIADLQDWLEAGVQLAQRAVASAPRSVAARVLLARLQRRSGQLIESQRTLLETAELTTMHSAVQREVARWLRAADHREAALEKYEAILAHYPGDAQSRMERWQLCRELGKATQYHSAWGQDEYVQRRFFALREPGVFVEVGAGAANNNSEFFERELGWRGVCIEASPTRHRELLRSRAANCINSYVSDELGAQTIDGARVDKQRLAQLLAQARLERVDYLAISVKQPEPVLRSLDLTRLPVAVITSPSLAEPLRTHLRRFGYLHDSTLGSDEVWYHPERASAQAPRQRLRARA